MNWKNILKILGITAGCLVVIISVLVFWGLSKLPSAFDIKKGMTPPALKETAQSETQSPPGATAPIEENLPAKEAAAEENSPATTQNEELKAEAYKVIIEDFSDHRRPLMDACRGMDKAADSGFLKDKKNASGKYFIQSLAQEERDPLSETAAPIMRTIFRAPGMDQVFDMIVKSDENKDPGLLKKAEFYYQIYRAGSYLKEHTDDMNRVLQQSYNLHNLMKAVAKKPELAKAPAVMTFCEDMQKSLNNGENFNADAASQEMVSFLEQNGIQPSDINFDPQYRSKIVLNVSNTQLGVNDAWIAQIFAADIEKALKKKQAQ